MKAINIKIKDVFGREIYYPACPLSELFCYFSSQKSITRAQLLHLISLGYEIHVEGRKLELNG